MVENVIEHDIYKMEQPIGVKIRNPRDILPPIDFAYGCKYKRNGKGVAQGNTYYIIKYICNKQH